VLEQLPPIVQPSDVSLAPSCALELPQQQKVCAVVNTCVYCCETIGQLEESISKAPPACTPPPPRPSFVPLGFTPSCLALLPQALREGAAGSDEVDLSSIKEEFQGVLTNGMKVLVAALETRFAPRLVEMCKVSTARPPPDQAACPPQRHPSSGA
jgi:hypothetical protein